MNSRFRLIILALICALQVCTKSAQAQKLLNTPLSGGPLSFIAPSSGGTNSSVSLAYSIRQLKTNYDHAAITPPSAVSGFTNSSTPLMRVRRSSDNGQLDIGYLLSGMLDTVTLKNFVGSGDGFVSVWYDQSGNSRDAIQATTASQPRIINNGVVDVNENGVPGMVIVNGQSIGDGGTSTDAISNRYGITGNRTLNVVCLPRIYANASIVGCCGTYVIDRNGASGDNPLTSFKTSSDKWGLQIRHDDGNGLGSSFEGSITVGTSRTDNLTAVRSGDTYSLEINGISAGSTTLAGVNSMAPLKMGYGSSTETVYYGEVLLFGSALSATDRFALNNNQNIFFGVGGGYTWKGSTSTDWSTASNWSNNTVPGEASNVTIPPGTTNALLITGAQTTLKARKLTVNSGAMMTINGNLSISDSVSVNGTINGSGTLTLNGIYKQYIKGTFANLTNSNSVETIYASADVTVNGTLINASAGKIDFLSNTFYGTAIISNSGNIYSRSINNPPMPTGKTWGGTVTYTGTTGGRQIPDGTYNNLVFDNTSGTNTATGTINVNGTLTIPAGGTLNMGDYQLGGNPTSISNSGTIKTSSNLQFPIPSGKTWGGTIEFTRTTGGQTIVSGTYNNLLLSNTSGTDTAGGNIGLTGTLTVTSGGTFDLTTYQFTGASGTIANSGTIKTANTTNPPLPTGKTWGGTVEYYASATQTIPNGTYNNLTLTSGIKNAGGDLVVNGTLMKDVLMDMGIYALSGTLTGISSAGEIRTANTSANPIPSGKYWGSAGWVTYNAATGGQSVAGGMYTHLNLDNTSGTQTANGDLSIDQRFIIRSGSTLNMGIHTLNGQITSPEVSGTLQTANTSATPIPSGKNWGSRPGTIHYNATAGGQTVVAATYRNLTMGNTSGTQTSAANLVVNGTLTTVTGGTLSLGTNTLTGTLGTITNNGTISTTNASATPLAPGKTWGGSGTVQYAVTTGAQTVVGGTYNNLLLSSTSGTNTAAGNIGLTGTLTVQSGSMFDLTTFQFTGASGVISSSGTIKTASTANPPLPTGKTWGGTIEYYATTGGQTVAGGTYNNLLFTNTSGTNTANGAVGADVNFTVPSGTTLDMLNYRLGGPMSGTVSMNGTIKTANTEATAIPTLKTWGGTVEYNNASGGQYVADGTYNNLTISNTSGAQTAWDNLIVNGILTTATSGAKLSMSTYTLSGTLATITNNGTIGTANTSASPLPSGRVWTGTIDYNASTGGQTVVSGTYYRLSLSNTSGTHTAGGDITATAFLSSTGGTFELNTNTFYSGTVVSNNGTIRTANTSASPFSNDKVWNGTVEYYAASGNQTIVSGSYNNLLMSNAIGTQSLNGTTTVGGTMTFSGGKLALGSNTLNMNGALNGHSINSSLIANGSSNISIGGAGSLGSDLYFDQATPGTSNRLNNLTYNRASQTVSLGNTLQVAGIVTPTAGTLATNNLLTLISNASGTASIAAGSGSYITGNVTAERYIPSVARRWRFLASPVTGATLSDWQNEIYITGAGGAANGFDATISNQAGAYTYNETVAGDHNTYGWVAPSNINTPLPTGIGFRVFIRGDRSDPGVLNGTNGTQAAVTMNALGAVNTGNIAMPVTFTSSGSIANDGWNLLGNPYPSPIDWNAFHDAGRTGISPDFTGTDYAHLDGVVSTYDANTNAYVSYNAISNTGIGVMSSGVIPSGAAFWVKASAASPAMTMREVYKTSATPAAMFKSVAEPIFTLKLIQDATASDEMIVKYIAEADNNFDRYDIAKLNGEVNISSITENGTLLSGNCKPFNGTSDIIRLNIGVGKSGNYSFEFKNVPHLVSDLSINLVDAFTHKTIDMNSNNSYTFNVDKTNAATMGNGRFSIVIGDLPKTTAEEEVIVSGHLSIYPAFTTGEVTISCNMPQNDDVSVKIIDAAGKETVTFNNLQWNNQKINLDLSAYKAGTYFITVTSASQSTVLKCTKQ